MDAIYHLAGQVAVTSSVDEPRLDFEINALRHPPMFWKLLGRVIENPLLFLRPLTRFMETWSPSQLLNWRLATLSRPTAGRSESQPVDFHSPYGCSKGAADQYVRDYARIYGLRTVVFRMSCIYGPRQFGTEDQGWLAHFVIASETEKLITIYGNGKQVRDVLFIDDLVRAFRLAVDKIDVTAGQVYNIGGGPENTIAVWREISKLLSGWKGREIPVRFKNWRPGDQPCYVSDIRKAHAHMGWTPQVTKEAGIRQLWDWGSSNKKLFPTPSMGISKPRVTEVRA